MSVRSNYVCMPHQWEFHRCIQWTNQGSCMWNCCCHRCTFPHSYRDLMNRHRSFHIFRQCILVNISSWSCWYHRCMFLHFHMDLTCIQVLHSSARLSQIYQLTVMYYQFHSDLLCNQLHMYSCTGQQFHCMLLHSDMGKSHILWFLKLRIFHICHKYLNSHHALPVSQWSPV